MAGENYTFVTASGTVLGVAGSHAASLVVLCGLSGTNIVPVQVNSAGQLVTSGA